MKMEGKWMQINGKFICLVGLGYWGKNIFRNLYELGKIQYDITITILEFKNGIKGHIFVSWLHPYKEQKLIVDDNVKIGDCFKVGSGGGI